VTRHQVAEAFHQSALIPLAWLTLREAMGRPSDRGYWVLAIAFAVSWVADSGAHWADPAVMSSTYVGLQASLIGMALLIRKEAALMVLALTMTGVVAVIVQHAQHQQLDVLFHTVAWLAVCGIVVDRWMLGRVRTALLTAFGLQWLCWLVLVAVRTYPAGYAFHGARVLGYGLFCWAAYRPEPSLRLEAA